MYKVHVGIITFIEVTHTNTICLLSTGSVLDHAHINGVETLF